MSITPKARNKTLVKIPSGLGRFRAPQYWRYVYRLTGMIINMFSIVVLFILSSASFAEDLSLLIETQKGWLKITDTCPADVIKKRNDNIDFIKSSCDLRIRDCFKKCSQKDGEACYNLAFTLQLEKYEEYVPYSEALFLKACEYGSISGCTNRAAGLQKYTGDKGLNCAVRTYEKSCSFDDPWSCTMYGYHLAVGKGVKKDLQKSLGVFKKSCRYGEEDPACQRALAFSKQIEEALEADKNVTKSSKATSKSGVN